MNDPTCSCPPNRPLGMEHVEPCALAGTARVVQIFRNPDTGRPVAVPEELVSEAEREYRAYKKSLRGLSWHQIALEESYLDVHDRPSGAVAAAAVKRYLDEGRAVVAGYTREEALATEIAVLRAMRDAMWDGAVVSKKPTHVMAILATSDRMIKVLGLDQAAEADLGTQTVVVPSEDYIAELRRIAPPLPDTG